MGRKTFYNNIIIISFKQENVDDTGSSMTLEFSKTTE